MKYKDIGFIECLNNLHTINKRTVLIKNETES